MTELQKIELEILKVFLDICEKENLKYYLVCGSALGAVKYHGFIPWDDDIDVALPRHDYEKFLLVANKYLPNWCFLQNYRTDKQFPLLGTKLRDSRTTYVECMCGGLNINHGVFIDVFPLDKHWKSHASKLKFLYLHREFEGKRRVNLQYRRISRGTIYWFQTNLYYILHKVFGVFNDTSKAIEKYERFLTTADVEDSYWCNYANSPSDKEYANKEQYGEGIYAEFEGLKVVIPEKFDEYLTQKYGDWRNDIPENQKVGHHYAEKIDLSKPYTSYFEKLSNGKIKLKI